jgi:hypothetical protein
MIKINKSSCLIEFDFFCIYQLNYFCITTLLGNDLGFGVETKLKILYNYRMDFGNKKHYLVIERSFPD